MADISLDRRMDDTVRSPLKWKMWGLSDICLIVFARKDRKSSSDTEGGFSYFSDFSETGSVLSGPKCLTLKTGFLDRLLVLLL
jgi:hypothetical protein